MEAKAVKKNLSNHHKKLSGPKLLSIALFLTSLLGPVEAKEGELLAWGHHKKTAKQESTGQESAANDSKTSITTTPSPLTDGEVKTVPPVQSPPTNALIQPLGEEIPVITTPASMIDLSSACFGKLSLDFQNAQFNDTSIERAGVLVSGMDFRRGSLSGLNIAILGGRFQQFIFDQLNLSTGPSLQFDPNLLLQDKVLQFSTPANAAVNVSVSQTSLNKFLADPKTLQNLSVKLGKRLGALAGLFGASASNFAVSIHEARVNLLSANKILIAITADLGMGGVGVPLSFEVGAQLGIKDGWVEVSDTHLMTNGQEISPQLSEMLVKKINSLASWGHKSDDIQFDFTEIKILPGKQLSLSGTALVKRMRLTKPHDDSSSLNTDSSPSPANSGPPNELKPAP